MVHQNNIMVMVPHNIVYKKIFKVETLEVRINMKIHKDTFMAAASFNRMTNMVNYSHSQLSKNHENCKRFSPQMFCLIR